MKTFLCEESVLRHNKRKYFPSYLDHYLSGSLQASFRVPGDLAREDDLCEEIALIELVSNI